MNRLGGSESRRASLKFGQEWNPVMSQEVSVFPSVTSNHPCNLCDSTAAEVVGTIDRDGKSLRTVMCSRCGLVWTDPRPTELETRNFYENEYRLAYKSTYTPRLKHALRETVRAVERADRWSALLSPSSRVLDIGSAGGFFFIPAGWNPLGYKITPLGQEFLTLDGSLDCDLGRFLASLKAGRRRTKALKASWLEIVRVSKTGQSMRIYRRLDDLILFSLRSGFIN